MTVRARRSRAQETPPSHPAQIFGPRAQRSSVHTLPKGRGCERERVSGSVGPTAVAPNASLPTQGTIQWQTTWNTGLHSLTPF